MSDFIIFSIMMIISIPTSYFILKLIFKKSIIVLSGFLMMVFAILASIISFYAGNKGIEVTIWGIPLSYIVGVTVLLVIRKLLKNPLEKSIAQVKELSEGNLNINVSKSNSEDELGTLNNSLFGLTNKLKSIIGTISVNSNNLVSASVQMSNASEQLSQGANEQASSIEEVSSAMEEISANIDQNSINSKETEKVSLEASESIDDIANKLLKAIDSTKEIAAKINVINDFAFQTNILALNAAVEAARAGENGKGFAVVAAEVRKLAENSKKAADDIASLAQTRLKFASEAGLVLSETTPKIANTSQLVQEIAEASVVQNQGANQVNKAIQQLNNITQQNASSSEELATSAEELAGQAENLKGILSFFSFTKKDNIPIEELKRNSNQNHQKLKGSNKINGPINLNI